MTPLLLAVAATVPLQSASAPAQLPVYRAVTCTDHGAAPVAVPFDIDQVVYAGVLNAATGVLTVPGSATQNLGPGLGDPIYANNSLPGTFYDVVAGGNGILLDEGRIPGPTSTSVIGTQDSYALTSFQIAYVTNATDPSLMGTGITIEIGLYENFETCGLPASTDAPIATVSLPGLPGSLNGGLRGVLLDVDVTGLGICMRADGGDGYSNGLDDLFGWSFEITDLADSTSGGLFIAGRPGLDPPGNGTVFQNPGTFGTGLDTQDAWRELHPSGTVECNSFGGYPAQPFGSFFLVVRSDLAGECIGCGIGDDRFEPNDSAASAAPVDVDSYSGLISNVDEDWYSLTIPPGSALIADLIFSQSTTDLDFFVLDASTGLPIDFGVSVTDNEQVFAANCSAVSDLDLLLRVQNFGQVCTEYDMGLRLDPLFGDDALEDNDSCAAATPLPLGVSADLVVRPYCGSGGTADDDDYFRYLLMPGDALSVDILFTHAVTDIDLVLYDVTSGCPGTALVQSLTTTDNETASVTNTTGSPIDVVVRVDHFRGVSSSYTLVTKSGPETIGELICLGTQNSVGAGARACASGSEVALDDDVTFDVTALPTNSLGYFVVSRDRFLLLNPGGSSGNLCIASLAVGRYAGNILNSGAGGAVSFHPSVASIPISGGGGSSSIAAMSGDTFNWQYWYRDVDGTGTPTSNFSDAVGVTFL